MRSSTRLFIVSLFFSAAVWSTARFTAENGTRAHRNRLAAGQYHTCTILDDGSVRCWGQNGAGQLGDGTFVTRTSPVAVVNLGPAVSIAAADFHTCAILTNSGQVRCWGANSLGQLGNTDLGIGTSVIASDVPVAVSGIANAIALGAGGFHTCAVIVDGSVWCWGDNSHGELGDGTNTTRATPQRVHGNSGAVAVVAGFHHTCALLANGTASCWGDNRNSQLGITPGPILESSVPLPVSIAGRLVFQSPRYMLDLTAGQNFTCARMSIGGMGCWGTNGAGEFGDGQFGNSGADQTYLTDGSAVAFAGGFGHACAITDDGEVHCWGANIQGQLADGTTINKALPGPPIPTITNAVEIAAGFAHTCALLAGGTIRCWGDNTFGQHGDGAAGQTGVDSVSGINGTFAGRAVAAGNQFTCARRGTGSVACWGANGSGQDGAPVGPFSVFPAAVNGVGNVIALSAGSDAHACALDAASSVFCWGDNSRGQLGSGTLTASSQPVPASTFPPSLPFKNPVSSVSAGDLHTCAVVLEGGGILCWGAGDRGQLGNGSTSDSLLPVFVPNGGDLVNTLHAVAVAAGDKFTCALIADGTVSCWGDNTSYQLGDGGLEAFSPVPKTVPGLVNMVAITAGSTHACALSAFGTVFCWGANASGQIGNNSTQPSPFPSTVEGLNDASGISAGAFFTCAAHAGGTVSCWGSNGSGELGTIDSLQHITQSPVTVDTTGNLLTQVVQIGAGTGFKRTVFSGGIVAIFPHQHTCALLASGIIRCWGDNSQGEIGDGTTTNRARPTVVSSFAANVDPDAALRNSRVAEVTALINCDAGDHAHIILALEQGSASGTVQTEARCLDRLVRVPMNVPAQGPTGFTAGAATAHVEAIVRSEGAILEDTHWTRQVTLSPAH